MFGQIKQKISHWCQNQIETLPTNQVETSEYDQLFNKVNAVMMLPRNSYFETYKTYPLSVGRDISKIAKVEGRQVSPYAGNVWTGTLIIKQPEQYLVYYFVLLPKYQELLDKAVPIFIVPETAHRLFQLSKEQEGAKAQGFVKDKDGIWVSQVQSQVALSNQLQSSFSWQQLTPPIVNAFFNPKVLVKLKQRFSRWQQVKWLSITAIVCACYLLLTNVYLMAMDSHLNNKNELARPVIGDLFKAKDALNLLQQQQQEFADIYQQATEKTGPLLLIEQQAEKFSLEVKAIEIVEQTVTLKATANNANGLLEQILNSGKVTQAEFKSDIKSAAGNKEQFELEFIWPYPLWQSNSNQIGQGQSELGLTKQGVSANG